MGLSPPRQVLGGCGTLPLGGEAVLGDDWRSGGYALLLLDGRCGVGWALLAVAVLLFSGGFDHSAHPVVAFGVGLDAVDLTFEAGEALAELFHRQDEADDGTVGTAETLAGHRHGDAGRVGNQHDGGDAAGHLVETNFFRLVAQEFLVGLRGGQDGVEVFVAGFADERGEVELDHCGVHLVGEFLEADIAIARGVLGDEFGERFFEWGFVVVEALELEEVFEEAAPLALGGSDGEEDEDGVVAGAGDLDAAAVEELGEDGGGDAPGVDLTLRGDAGHEDGDLGGVQHAVLVGDVFVLKSVPVFAGLEGPATGVGGEEIVVRGFEEMGGAVGGVGDLLGLEEAEEPAAAAVVLGAEAVGNRRHCFAEADGILNRLVHQGGASGFIHHGSSYVEARD